MGIIWINKVYSKNNRSLPGGAFDLLIQFLDGSASAWRQSGREDVAIRTSWSRDPAWRSLLSRQESCFSSTWFLIYYCFCKSTLTLTFQYKVFKIGIVYYCPRNNCWHYTTLIFWSSLIFNIINLFKVNVVILSYLTNVIVDALGEDANEGCLNQLFIEMFTHNDGLFGFCQSFPLIRVFLAPPNVRNRPLWYSRLRPTIIRVLHRFMQSRPRNLQLLDDYAGDLDQDGVHFTILSGMNFVKALADQVTELVQSAPPEVSIRFVLILIATLHSDPQFFDIFSTLDWVYVVYRDYRD